jgi:hypothetical protein
MVRADIYFDVTIGMSRFFRMFLIRVATARQPYDNVSDLRLISPWGHFDESCRSENVGRAVQVCAGLAREARQTSTLKGVTDIMGALAMWVQFGITVGDRREFQLIQVPV